jgi:hypothetical protein
MTIIDGHPEERADERVRFFPRQLINADDLNLEQHYHRQRLREHNRFLHGWGVVCGCDVQAAPTTDRPWLVRVCPGYAIAPQGDPIRIRGQLLFDVASCFLNADDPCAYARPCPPVTRRTLESSTIYLAVRAIECESQPVRVAPLGCGCDDVACEYSRIRDGYELSCLSQLPSTHAPAELDVEAILASTAIVPCPSCPSDPWVVLATIRPPTSRSAQISDVAPLENRRRLLSTAILQAAVEP